jgi:hypothetical protein
MPANIEMTVEGKSVTSYGMVSYSRITYALRRGKTFP